MKTRRLVFSHIALYVFGRLRNGRLRGIMPEEILFDGEKQKRDHNGQHYTNADPLFHAFSYDVVV